LFGHRSEPNADTERGSRMKKTPPPIGRAAERLAKRDVDYGFEDQLIPIDAVMQIAGIGKTMIYEKMKAGTFPQSCKPGGASVRWSRREVTDWAAQILADRGVA
jgi:prophage regulatory protein